MQVKLKYEGDEEFSALNENGNQVNIDMRQPDLKAHQSPMELLLSAVGACAAVEIVSMVKKRRKTFINIEAEISGNRKDDHPRAFTEVHLKYIITSPDLTDAEAERIVELATSKYCSVAGSIGAKQTHSFEILRK